MLREQLSDLAVVDCIPRPRRACDVIVSHLLYSRRSNDVSARYHVTKIFSAHGSKVTRKYCEEEGEGL